MRIAAVILNWRRPQDTIACVRALDEAAPNVRPIVVDNGSRDGSVELMSGALPGVRLIENATNLGYAGGNNAGIREALGSDVDAVFVLNNDALVRPGCIEALTDALHWRQEWGLVGPLSLRTDDPEIVDFFTATVDLRNVAVLAWGRDERRTFDAAERTDYVTGSALMVRRQVFDRIGLFDERFFLVWEDVDLAFRARAAGFDAGVTPRAQVLHGRSKSFGGDGAPLHRYFFVRNSFLMVAKYLRWPWSVRARRMATRRYDGWAAGRRSDVERAMSLGLEHGLAGRFGAPPADLLELAVAR